MAEYQSHISFSAILGVGYVFFGMIFLGVTPEHSLLGLAIIIVAGILPDLDAKAGAPVRELSALLAAIAPIALISYFPQLSSGGLARIALLIILCYLVTRVFLVRALKQFTERRGMIHSIPAAIIAFQVTYLIFWDLARVERLYIAGAAFLGYLSHLLLDATSSVDLLGHTFGDGDKKPRSLKIAASTPGGTAALYLSVAVLGWLVVQDLYPNLRVFAGVSTK